MNIFLFGEQILPEYHTRYVGLDNRVTQEIKILCVQ